MTNHSFMTVYFLPLCSPFVVSNTNASLFFLCTGKALCLEELVINPHQQQMEPFHWVMDWEGMLSPSSLVSILDKNFFPKWLQVSEFISVKHSV